MKNKLKGKVFTAQKVQSILNGSKITVREITWNIAQTNKKNQRELRKLKIRESKLFKKIKKTSLEYQKLGVALQFNPDKSA
jgi:hypothetical protein